MARPPVYVASPLGFAKTSKYFYDEVLLPELRAGGFDPLDPWLGAAPIEAAMRISNPAERFEALVAANVEVGRQNENLLAQATAVFAVLDGPDVDSGTAAEIGWAAALRLPVVGWKTDLRLASDNEAAVVNLQVQYFIERSGGRIERDLDRAIRLLGGLAVGQDGSRVLS